MQRKLKEKAELFRQGKLSAEMQPVCETMDFFLLDEQKVSVIIGTYQQEV